MMTKADIIGATLDQLIERFHQAPDSFECVGDYSVFWQTKLQVADNLVTDPNNIQRAIIISYSDIGKEMILKIFNENFSSGSMAEGRNSNGLVECGRLLERFRGNYRKLMKLHKMVSKYQADKHAKESLDKLSLIFPAVIDHLFLGK